MVNKIYFLIIKKINENNKRKKNSTMIRNSTETSVLIVEEIF